MTHCSRALAILRRPGVAAGGVAMLVAIASGAAHAHGIAGDDQAFLLRNSGANIAAYVYLGAKHMVTGYDHLLFLAGVIFFLYRLREVALYVTLFAVGHSTTLLLGVLGGLHVNSYLVDAVIGLSVVYKAFENLGGFRALGWQPNMRGCRSDFRILPWLWPGHEASGPRALARGPRDQHAVVQRRCRNRPALGFELILIVFNMWRTSGTFLRYAYASNFALLTAGFVLIGYQLTGYAIA